MGFVLEHVEDPAVLLKRHRDFLTPGGKVVVGVPNAESLHRWFGHTAALLEDMDALGSGDLALGHLEVSTWRHWIRCWTTART